MIKPSLRDTLIFIVIFSIIVAAIFALFFSGCVNGGEARGRKEYWR